MQHILHSNKFIYAVLALGALFFAGGLITYTGSAATYAVFTLIFMLTLASGFYGKFSYSYFFLVIFIWLGFWLKLTVHSIFDYTYVEPTGIFDGSSSSWDEVLWVAIAAGAGVMVGRLSYARLVRNSGSEATGTAAVPAWYPKFRNLVWAMMLLVMISIAAGNAFYGIQQIGMVPRTVFPWPFNAVIAWMTSIGSAMGVATLVWWDIVSKRKFSTSIYAILLEACLSTVSLLSRGVYIFHTIPQLLSLHKNRRILSGTSFRQVIVLAVVFVSLFVGTMAIINVLRGYLYPHQGLTISTSINQMRLTQVEVLNAKIHQIEKMIPSNPSPEALRRFYKLHGLKAGVPLEVQLVHFIELRANYSTALAEEEVRGKEIAHSTVGQFKVLMEEMAYQLKGGAIERTSQLLVDRWVGLEGVMAVQSYGAKGSALLLEGIAEKREIGKVPLYQEICRSHYRLMDAKTWQFGSLPGASAFLYYSGSVWIVMLGMAVLSLVLLVLERFVYALTRNPILCALLGFNLANFVAQLGMTPRQDLPSYAMMFGGVLAIWLVQSGKIEAGFAKIKLYRHTS
ncbi:hypothetical protein [Polaromonas sp.]|jgi:hypothetical protein|uniref:hypothetical protein n=1 Tax=Polaromonas sp. TaxID=1869339 RepID=UPI0037C80A81